MTTPSESQPDAPPARRGSNILLSDHHHRLEATCRALLGHAYTDDARALTLSWNGVEPQLLDHMAAEEEVILPSYELHAPDDARRIRDDHARIRALLTPIGVEVELHEIRLARLRQLVATLEAHSASEDAGMYPWAAQHVALVSQRMLYARISRGFERE
ncbi:MAG: hemerythrin domain-containing protein [Kofleriaceae bacterium]